MKQYRDMTVDERLETVARMLLTDNLTYAQIGDALGVTRNVIAGFCNRKHIRLTPESVTGPVRRANVMRAKPREYTVPKPKRLPPIVISSDYSAHMKPPTLTAATMWEPINGGARLVSVEAVGHHQCRWPIGHRTHLVCGEPTIGNSPYCATHSDKAFKPEVAKKGRLPVA